MTDKLIAVAVSREACESGTRSPQGLRFSLKRQWGVAYNMGAQLPAY